MTAVEDIAWPEDPEAQREVLTRIASEMQSVRTDDGGQAATATMLSIARRIKAQRGMLNEVVVPPLRDHIATMDPAYAFRPHLEYLITRLEAAVARVEAGESVWIRISMPPRSGKTDLTTIKFPTWLLRKHPDWHFGLMSHTSPLAASWGREIRRAVLSHPEWGVQLAKDAGAVTSWETVDKGRMLSKGVGEAISGVGFKVLIGDDIIGDAADAASPTKRDGLWAKYATDMLGRREPPTLYIMIGTRFHEDDLLGRLSNREFEQKPERWEVIELPAIADISDVLGRMPGDPLFSPLLEETKDEAIERWAEVKAQVGSYAWSSLYQQRPSPADGDIFNGDWWRFWTTNPKNATEDGRVVYWNPYEQTVHGRWVDSWDLAFKGSDTSDFVVGQRWAAIGPNRYLVAQARGRWDFLQSLHRIEEWCEPESCGGTGRLVHERIIEDAANGPAVVSTLQDEVGGIIPIKPWGSKEARARACTPEIESRHVFLPFPGDPGHEWVPDLLSEFAAFPRGTHDDSVDATTQALNRLKVGHGSVVVPGRVNTDPVRRAIRNSTPSMGRRIIR